MKMMNAFALLRNDWRLLGLIMLGMGSGASLTLLAGTLGFWLRETGFSTSAIGFLGLATLPFVLKFLWTPLLDTAFPPLRKLLGYRRSVLIPLNMCAVLAIVAMSRVDPQGGLSTIALIAFVYSFFASSSEAVAEAFRLDRTRDGRLAMGVAFMSIGARVGGILGTTIPLVIAARYGWSAAFVSLACVMAMVSVGALILGEHDDDEVYKKRDALSLAARIVGPFREFFTRRGAIVLFLFVVFHRLGDGMAGLMLAPMMVDLGFSKDQVAASNFVAGLGGLLIGAAIGVWAYRNTIERLGLTIALFIMAATNIGFVLLSQSPPKTTILISVMACESIAGGIGSVIVLSFLSRICDVRFSATQYALMLAATAATRTILGSASGVMVEMLGYTNFYLITILLFTPAFLLLWVLSRMGVVAATQPNAAIK
jgi:MFS transporter, PAT family, beta-lactamase induction signal transducer AmpG